MLFDVIIVGAGPGGLISAIHCAKAGLKVALVEKKRIPVHKICGDGFTTPVLTELRHIDEALYSQFVSEISSSKINHIRFYSDKETFISKTLTSPIYTCKRDRFQQLLYSELNRHFYTLFENTAVVSMSENSNEVSCQLSDGQILIAKTIIGADGVSSMVRKNLQPQNQPTTSICIRTYYENVDFPADTIALFTNPHLPSAGIWLFPLGNSVVNIGYGLHQTLQKQKQINLIEEFEQQMAASPELQKAFANARQTDGYKGGQITIYNGKQTLSGDRYFLVGDAASLADPLNGEGIGYAMASGRYAAEEVIRCIQTNHFEARQNKTYDKKVYQRIGKWSRQSQMILWIWYHFSWVFSIMGKLSKLPLMGKIIRKFI